MLLLGQAIKRARIKYELYIGIITQGFKITIIKTLKDIVEKMDSVINS